MLSQLVAADLFSLVLVFARIGSAIMLLPGFGEVYVSGRIRLIIALALTLVITPVVGTHLPDLPKGPLELFVLIGSEVLIGLFLGALARFLVSSLHVAGVVIGYQSSLANAQLFDPNTAQQGSLIGTFLNVLGVFPDLHRQPAPPDAAGADRQLFAVHSRRADPGRRFRRDGESAARAELRAGAQDRPRRSW